MGARMREGMGSGRPCQPAQPAGLALAPAATCRPANVTSLGMRGGWVLGYGGGMGACTLALLFAGLPLFPAWLVAVILFVIFIIVVCMEADGGPV